MDAQPQTAPAAASAVLAASTSAASSPLPTLTPSDSEKLLSALLRRHNISMEPLEFWKRVFAWVNDAIDFQLETDASTLHFDIPQEYIHVHYPFLKIKQEGRLAQGTQNTFADGLFYVTRQSIRDSQPDVYIPLSVFELKSDLGGSNAFRKKAILQLFFAMRGRLWNGDPPYNPEWGRPDFTKPARLCRHTPIFGYQFCGTSGRRMVGLAPDLFFIDTKKNQEVRYEESEWTTHLYNHSRVRLDHHVHIIRMYAEYIKNLPKHRDIQAYGDLTITPNADRTLMDGWSRAVHDDPATMGMVLFEGPPFEQGKNHDGSQGDDGGEAGPSRVGDDGTRGEGGRSTGRKDKRRRGPSTEEGEGSPPPTKRLTQQLDMQRDALTLPHLSEPSEVPSDETEDLLNTPAVTEGAFPVQHAPSSSQDSSTADHPQSDVKVYANLLNVSSAPTYIPSTDEHISDLNTRVWDALARSWYTPVTKEMDEEMRRCIRPMWTMSSEERKRVFGFLGPDWELFATWYVGCPVVTR